MASNQKDVLESIDSSNIFDEFEAGELKKDIEDKKTTKKDMYDYLTLGWGILSGLFWIGLIVAIIWFGYTYAQKNEELSNSNLLSPICILFNGNIPSSAGWCDSITYLENHYKEKLQTEKSETFSKIVSLLEEVYKIENFNKSKEVIFLSQQSANKIPVTQVLSDFDDLLYDYDSSKMNQIQCKDIIMNEEMVIEMKCNTYTSGLDNSIRWIERNEKIRGTSITLANSFLYYIENNAENFELIDRQKTFKINQYYSDDTPYTKTTEFDLKMQYIPTNNLNSK